MSRVTSLLWVDREVLRKAVTWYSFHFRTPFLATVWKMGWKDNEWGQGSEMSRPCLEHWWLPGRKLDLWRASGELKSVAVWNISFWDFDVHTCVKYNMHDSHIIQDLWIKTLEKTLSRWWTVSHVSPYCWSFPLTCAGQGHSIRLGTMCNWNWARVTYVTLRLHFAIGLRMKDFLTKLMSDD